MRTRLQSDMVRGTAFIAVLILVQPLPAAEPVDGFVAPFSTIEVATAETGIAREILVREGETVEPGQVLVRLDAEVHAALLAMAEQAMQSEGRLAAARAEARVRRQRRDKLRELLTRGSARQEELERAQADLEIAEGQLRAIEEDLAIKRLEHQRAKFQLERRTIRAPTDGVVLKRHKEVGEFVGPSDPALLTIVQLNPLLAVFAVPSREARLLRVGDVARVRLADSDNIIAGKIEFISPVIDGKSGTMRVEVRLPNPRRKHFSGDPCSLLWDDGSEETVASDLTAE